MADKLQKNQIFSLIEPFGEKIILEKGQSLERVDGMLPFAYLAGGKVRVFMESDDEEKKTFIDVSEGEFLGETTYYDCDFHEIVIIALTECQILSIPHENLAKLKKNSKEIEPNVYDSLGKKVKYLAESTREPRMGVRGRIARAMLQMAEGLEAQYGDETWAILKCPREDVAILAKTSVSTATGELKVMQVNGILESRFRRIEIRKPEELKKIVSGE